MRVVTVGLDLNYHTLRSLYMSVVFIKKKVLLVRCEKRAKIHSMTRNKLLAIYSTVYQSIHIMIYMLSNIIHSHDSEILANSAITRLVWISMFTH